MFRRPTEWEITAETQEVFVLQFDPFRDFDRLTRETRDRAPSVMAFDAIRDDDAVTLYFDVPGITAEDLDINVDRTELTITAQRVWDGDDKEILVNERPQGTFTRRLMLSDSLDTDQLVANLGEGVLTVTIPVAERSKPRKIEVTMDSERDAIEVSGGEHSGDDH